MAALKLNVGDCHAELLGVGGGSHFDLLACHRLTDTRYGMVQGQEFEVAKFTTCLPECWKRDSQLKGRQDHPSAFAGLAGRLPQSFGYPGCRPLARNGGTLCRPSRFAGNSLV